MSHLNDSFTASLTLKIILLVNYTPVILLVVKFGHINLHIMNVCTARRHLIQSFYLILYHFQHFRL